VPTQDLPALEEECFFIGPIGDEDSEERKRSDGVLEFIVGRASEELALRAVRADQIAEPGQINLQILNHVLGARGAVADLTGLNPNVFYELAVRHTARLPIVLIAEKGQKLPFDIAQMRTIFFDHRDLKSADDCRQGIVDQLREGLDGAVDSPIATAVDVTALSGGNQVERAIADLLSAVEDIGRSQRESNYLLEEIRVLPAGGRRDPKVMEALDYAWTNALAVLDRLSDTEDSEQTAQLSSALEAMSFGLDRLRRRPTRMTYTSRFVERQSRARSGEVSDEPEDERDDGD
jgi:hypothetical protein